MDWLRRLRHRVRLLTLHAEVERQMAAEMLDHVEQETAELIRNGMAPEAARRAALVAFGGIERFKEEGRDARGARLVEDLAADLRHALRVLRRNPGFALAAVATFGLGIGASTAIFSVVHGVLLAPLPYRQPDRLVALWERNLSTGRDNVVSVDEFDDWRLQLHSLSGMAALVPAPVTVRHAGEVERVAGVQVSPGYFGLLGVAPALGREFTPAEAANGGEPVTILSDEYWKRRFAGDSGVVGRSLMIDGRPVTVVGVMPAGFEPPRYGWIDEQDLWLPFGATAENRAWGHVLHVVGRLRPGVSLSTANQELARVGRLLAGDRPQYHERSPVANDLAREMTGEVRQPLLLLLGGVLLLLLMAVTNVANLTLGLIRRREHELAVRRALGASASRLARQLFTQSAVLGALGCAVGLVVAVGGVRMLLGLMPPAVPHAGAIQVNGPVLLAALAVTVLATIAFGTVAGLGGARRSGGEAAVPGTSRSRVTARLGAGPLITVELALAMILTLLAGLMARSFAKLRAVDLGFDASRVVAGRVALTADRYGSPNAERAFFDRLVERLRQTPGVSSAGMVTVRPFRGGAPTTSVTDPVHPFPPGIEPPIADIRFADSALFGTLGIPMLVGSPFAEREPATGPARVVVNPSLVRALGFSGNPIGRRVAIALNGGIDAEIVGLAGDVHLVNPRTPPRSTAWLAADRYPDRVNDILVRGTGDAAGLARALREAAGAIDPMVPVYEVEPLEDRVDRSLARDRFTTFLLGAFSLTALLLAAVGITGVLSADVTRRRGEIGVRRALGAGAASIVGLVLRRGLTRAVVGIAIGTVVALGLARGIASLLFGIGTGDLTALIGVTLVLLVTATAAALVPAWRAIQVSPLTAIRGEGG
jgi:putative ABC transport system permease protein